MYKISVKENNLFFTKKAININHTVLFQSLTLFDIIINLLWNNLIRSSNIYYNNIYIL